MLPGVERCLTKDRVHILVTRYLRCQLCSRTTASSKDMVRAEAPNPGGGILPPYARGK